VRHRADARPIVIDRTGATVQADFSLLRLPFHIVHGHVQGIPLNGAEDFQVILQSEPFDFVQMVPPVGLDHGKFQFPRVPEGRYLAFLVRENDEDASLIFVSPAVELEVHDTVDDLTLQFVGKH
jgi:hypothetical protein